MTRRCTIKVLPLVGSLVYKSYLRNVLHLMDRGRCHVTHELLEKRDATSARLGKEVNLQRVYRRLSFYAKTDHGTWSIGQQMIYLAPRRN